MKTKEELNKMTMKELLNEGKKAQSEIDALRSKGYTMHSDEVSALMQYNSVILESMVQNRKKANRKHIMTR